MNIFQKNEVFTQDDFYVSFLNDSSSPYEVEETTALVLGQAQACFVLKGDHREGYKKCSDELKQCMEYFINHMDQASKYSEHFPAFKFIEEDPFHISNCLEKHLGEELYKQICIKAKEKYEQIQSNS